MADKELIDKFRDRVVQSDFVLFNYRNKQGKNQWNCICSAMDWITVAIEYINTFDKKKKHIQSMEMFSYIASIDIIWESIQQLHRVITVTKNIPFYNEHECFKGNKFNESDNDYFKTIRACFGAHSVNLKDPSDSNARRFASWSGSHFGEGDYSVLLYSNQLDGKDILISIYFDELDAFLNKRYEYLNTLIEVLDVQNKEFKKKVSKIAIKKSMDSSVQLKILAEVSKQRMDNEYYNSIINKLSMLFSVQVTCNENSDMVNKYLEALKPLIQEIYQNLSECNICDLNTDLLYQSSKMLPDGSQYWLEKLSDYIYGGGYDPCFWLKHIKELFEEKFVFKFESYEELFLLIQACIYKMNM